MPAIGRIDKTQTQNLRQYKRIAVAASVDRGKTGNGIAQPRSTPSATGRFLLHGRGAGVGRVLGVTLGRAVGVGLGVDVAVTVAVAVGVTVAVAVAVAVGVAVPVAVAVAVGVAVGVGDGVPTAAAISTRPQPTTLFGGPGVPHCL